MGLFGGYNHVSLHVTTLLKKYILYVTVKLGLWRVTMCRGPCCVATAC